MVTRGKQHLTSQNYEGLRSLVRNGAIGSRSEGYIPDPPTAKPIVRQLVIGSYGPSECEGTSCMKG